MERARHQLRVVQQSEKQAIWLNAFSEKAVMVVQRNNQSDQAQTWVYEKVNVRQDLMRYLDLDQTTIEGAAIMTDTDNSGDVARARYGDIFFSSE